jgi:hypothetical protein
MVCIGGGMVCDRKASSVLSLIYVGVGGVVVRGSWRRNAVEGFRLASTSHNLILVAELHKDPNDLTCGLKR